MTYTRLYACLDIHPYVMHTYIFHGDVPTARTHMHEHIIYNI